jgi:hypothetical protein
VHAKGEIHWGRKTKQKRKTSYFVFFFLFLIWVLC